MEELNAQILDFKKVVKPDGTGHYTVRPLPLAIAHLAKTIVWGLGFQKLESFEEFPRR
jgi:hypothetical protein